MVKTELTIEQTMSGMLALLAVMREDALNSKSGDFRKTELVLADSGIPTAQIALILGKKQDTVQKAILRSRKNTSQSTGESANGKK